MGKYLFFASLVAFLIAAFDRAPHMSERWKFFAQVGLYSTIGMVVGVLFWLFG